MKKGGKPPFFSALCLGLHQPGIAEIDQDAAGDHGQVQEVEEHDVPLHHVRPGSGGPGHVDIVVDRKEFSDDGKNVSDPDQKIKGQAHSGGGAGFPGLDDVQGPGKTETYHHQHFHDTGDS